MGYKQYQHSTFVTTPKKNKKKNSDNAILFIHYRLFMSNGNYFSVTLSVATFSSVTLSSGRFSLAVAIQAAQNKVNRAKK